jgi:hypothetical protein
MQVSKRKPKKSETPKDIVALEIEQCKSILGSMSDRLDEFNLSGIDEAGLRKLRKLIKNIKSSSSLLDIIHDSDKRSSQIIETLYKVFFGRSNEDSRIMFRRGYVEDFYINLDPVTLDTIEKRFIKKQPIKGSISFSDAVKNGTTDIGWIDSFNGISRKDLKEIYTIDAYFPSGKRRRGKGETLSCLSFGGFINNERGADIFIDGNRVEVKSTISASITSEDNLVSPKIKQFIDLSYRISGKSKKKEKTYGKRSLNLLLAKIKSSQIKANEFWKRFHQIVGFRTDRDPDKIVPILICHQIEHYSKPENFNTMIIYSENTGGFPDALSVLVKNESFVNDRNIEILNDLNIYFRVYPNKVEIFL